MRLTRKLHEELEYQAGRMEDCSKRDYLNAMRETFEANKDWIEAEKRLQKYLPQRNKRPSRIKVKVYKRAGIMGDKNVRV